MNRMLIKEVFLNFHLFSNHWKKSFGIVFFFLIASPHLISVQIKENKISMIQEEKNTIYILIVL